MRPALLVLVVSAFAATLGIAGEILGSHPEGIAACEQRVRSTAKEIAVKPGLGESKRTIASAAQLCGEGELGHAQQLLDQVEQDIQQASLRTQR